MTAPVQRVILQGLSSCPSPLVLPGKQRLTRRKESDVINVHLCYHIQEEGLDQTPHSTESNVTRKRYNTHNSDGIIVLLHRHREREGGGERERERGRERERERDGEREREKSRRKKRCSRKYADRQKANS